MKPIKKTKIVQLEYWDCGDIDHNHNSEDSAQNCIDKREKILPSFDFIKWTKEKYAEVLKEYRGGVRKYDLAKKLGISSERMRQVITKAEKLDRLGLVSNDQIDDLSVRTRNVLARMGLRTVEEVRAALEDGRLKNVPGFGKTSKTELRLWLDSFPSN